MSHAFRGIFTPLVTPLTSREEPDLESMSRLVRFQLSNGVHGLWAMGTSAEFASFDGAERAAVVDAVCRTAAGHVPVIANVSDASTRLAIRHAERAVAAGADAIACTPPYYYPHTQDELLTHFSVLHDAVPVPLFLYNIPQTVRVKLELSTVKQLIVGGVVRGIKDSQNDLEWLRSLALFARREGADFAVFAGTRHLIDAAVLAGAQGAIPSAANAFPDLCVRVFEAAVGGDFRRADEYQVRIVDIEGATAMLQGGSRNAAILGMLKAVLHRRGIIADPRLASPLRQIQREEREVLLDRISDLVEAHASH